MSFPQKKILDVGVGNGRSTYYLSNQLAPTSIIGIDYSETAIKQAKKNYPTLLFQLVPIEDTGFQEKFDLICAFQTHFHWSDLTQAFSEIQRILAPQGIVLIAAEKTKIAYFLPHLKTAQQLEKFLFPFQLALINTRENAQWVCYEIQNISKSTI
ncbi:class I SAM-dependent methyltransferase [Enterococcus sp. AZ194]|uniref:class I SAM-dependent methyltransferase n=1 Tax=Enterococcus sp. AZ194 TaxID=2774629 RepID=UPI003F68844D